jgi:AcrR family transcriptional regulator
MSEHEDLQENKRDRQARDTKARLLAAALTLFAQNGVSSTSIKDIAREAGVAQGLLYHYFASKDDLLWGVLEADTFLPQLQDIFGGSERQPAGEVLTEVALRFDAFLADRQAMMRLILGELQSNPRIQALWEEGIRREELILQEFLRARTAAGELRAHDVEVTTRMLMYGVVLLHLPGGKTAGGNPAFLTAMIETLMRGINAEK